MLNIKYTLLWKWPLFIALLDFVPKPGGALSAGKFTLGPSFILINIAFNNKLLPHQNSSDFYPTPHPNWTST